MEGSICCAYNTSKSCYVSSKVAIADRTDQPLTILRLLVEGLGFKASTSLWLNPLHGAPQLVRPFPFDLVYLDANMRVIQAVELLPEVSFPPFDDRATSALILPIRTISSTGIQRNDELVICSKEELENRNADVKLQPELVAVAAASAWGKSQAGITTIDAPPVAGAMDAPGPSPVAGSMPTVSPAAPIPFLSPPAFVPTRTSTAAPLAGFSSAITTTWQFVGSTAAVVPGSIDVDPQETAVGDSAQAESSGEAVLDTPVSTEPDASEEEEETATDLSVGDVIATAVPDKINPDEEEKRENPTILDIPAAASVNVASPEEARPVPLPGSPAIDLAAIRSAQLRAIPAVVQKPAPPETKPEIPREKVARAVSAAAVEERKPKATEKKKRMQSFGTMVKGFLNCPDPPPEYRDAARLVQQGLLAQDRSDSSNWMEVRDVSPSGFYLRTKKQWKLGDILSLTLQRKGATEVEYESCVDVQGRVVRQDQGGVGLTWVFPKDLKFQPWERLHTKRSDESDIQYFIREIRLARALNFLQRICPLASEEIRHALIDRLSNKRVSSAVEIALQAEQAFGLNARGAKVLAHSNVLMKIVESGSWIEDNWIRRMWAGLLVSSCDTDGQDTSNIAFIDLLARLTPIHLRILSFVCKKFDDAVTAGASPEKLHVYCTAEELTIAADSHSFARIQQTVGQLASVGLLLESARPSYFSVTDKEKTRTTPTALGLKMYARCHGRRS